MNWVKEIFKGSGMKTSNIKKSQENFEKVILVPAVKCSQFNGLDPKSLVSTWQNVLGSMKSK